VVVVLVALEASVSTISNFLNVVVTDSVVITLNNADVYYNLLIHIARGFLILGIFVSVENFILSLSH
jgi:hypothetical protein